VDQTPLPLGMVWNMVYDAAAPAGTLPSITSAQLWDRVDRFLDELLPVAEKYGVTLALHPDDPPAPTVRGTPRLVYRPDLYQRLIDRHPSPSTGLEFCVGTIAEMRDGDVYEATERYSAQGRLAYVHLRNVRGKMPSYRETFIDDGDLDVIRILGILKKTGYQGVLIPDHTPLPECASPWHTGMAYAIGFIRAVLMVIQG
jgi:mannonate dehydratase